MQVDIGKRLKAIIKEEGFSQREFAEEMNLSTRTIEQYINGKRNPSGELFASMCNHAVFEKYLSWLLTGNTKPSSGQICPAFSTQEQCGLIAGKIDTLKKA